MSLGTWPLSTDRERDALAFLIQHLPADGRYEVVIRPTTEDKPMPLTIEDVCASMAIKGGALPSLTEAVRIKPPGHVLEFGVFYGDSLRHIASQVPRLTNSSSETTARTSSGRRRGGRWRFLVTLRPGSKPSSGHRLSCRLPLQFRGPCRLVRIPRLPDQPCQWQA